MIDFGFLQFASPWALLLLIALPANLLPLIAALGWMGWTGTSLRLGTALVMAVALAIAVDDTIHLLTHAESVRRKGMSARRASGPDIQAPHRSGASQPEARRRCRCRAASIDRSPTAVAGECIAVPGASHSIRRQVLPVSVDRHTNDWLRYCAAHSASGIVRRYRCVSPVWAAIRMLPSSATTLTGSPPPRC